MVIARYFEDLSASSYLLRDILVGFSNDELAFLSSYFSKLIISSSI